MTAEVRLSVRELVEYVYSSGSIDSGFRSSTTLTDGIKAHQQIQKGYGEQDQKEVYFKMELPVEGILFQMDGRCDGLLRKEDEVTIDEIKSTSRPLDEISADTHPVHWAQARFYAYMAAKELDLKKVNVQLTYVQKETNEQRQFIETKTVTELSEFVIEVCSNYAPYAAKKIEHRTLRNKSIKSLEFPFATYRPGQRKLAGAVYKSIADEKNLFAKAPTGIGKTISTTFPAVKAIGEDHINRLFYLTAKTITREAAEEAFSLMHKNGLHLNTVTITAKDKICFQEETRCDQDHCPFADGYYDRINEAVLDIMTNETMMNRQTIEHYARKHQVCPFEFSLDVAYAAADAIICDYNYVFDPKVSLKRFFEEEKKQTVLLVDEAHNLVDRAREMYSADLFKSAFLQIKRDYKNSHPALASAAKAINDTLLSMKKEILSGEAETVRKEHPDQLVEMLETFIDQAERELMRSQNGEAVKTLLELYFAAQAFNRIANLYNDRFVTYIEIEKSEVHIKLFCLDPSELLRQAGRNYRAKIYFSATLTPADYFLDLLGGGSEDYTVTIPSPFSPDQTDVVIHPLSTKYKDRERTVVRLTELIQQYVTGREGNYLVFFPSYQYMKMVVERFLEEDLHVETIIQGSGMAEAEREAFLSTFQADRGKTLVGFAVLGGIFSEGIDLKGDRLTGVIIVGVGLPQLGLERNIIKDYFQSIGKNGYDYAYLFPGMNKVLQAGGRLIRSETDQGLIVLVDDRYLQRKYQALLPQEWKQGAVVEASSLQ